ncbi:MAG: hypothetical protein IJN37_03175 [Clostridia bacterium]|nr:hypothetical protein [Clostridia bacterium]
MKKLTRFKISRRTGGCIIILLVLAVIFILNLLHDEPMFMFPDYHYGFLSHRILSWNLRELGNYPEHQIIYVKPAWMKKSSGSYIAFGYIDEIEVGVYPYLDEELEKRIRALGYPFDFHGITYVGTDNYEDISKTVLGDFSSSKDVKKFISPDADLWY